MIKIDKSNSDEISIKYLVPRGEYCHWEGTVEEGHELCPLFECTPTDRCRGFNLPLDREDYLDYAGVRCSRVIKCERCLDADKVGNNRILVSNDGSRNLSDSYLIGEIERELE